MIFTSAKRILSKTEVYYLGLKKPESIVVTFFNFCVSGYRFQKMGIKNFFLPLSKASLYFSLLLFTVWALLKLMNIELQPDLILVIFYICFATVLLLLTFAIPSSYVFDAITEKDINKVVEFIKDESLLNTEQVDLLETNMELLFDRVNARVSMYRWMIGTFWATYLLFFNFALKVMPKSLSEQLQAELAEMFILLPQIAVLTLLVLAMISGYKRANEIVFKSISFGCSEYKNKLLVR